MNSGEGASGDTVTLFPNSVWNPSLRSSLVDSLSLSLKTQLGRIRQELQWGLGAKRVTSISLRVSDESLYQKKGSATMHEGGKSLTHRVLLHASVQLEPQRSIGRNGCLCSVAVRQPL